jgi:hypothetical protein
MRLALYGKFGCGNRSKKIFKHSKITKKRGLKKVDKCKVNRVAKNSEPFLSLAKSICPELVEVRFEKLQGFFPESRTASFGKRDVCSETPSPISSTSVGDFQCVKILDAPFPILAASKPTLSSSPR